MNRIQIEAAGPWVRFSRWHTNLYSPPGFLREILVDATTAAVVLLIAAPLLYWVFGMGFWLVATVGWVCYSAGAVGGYAHRIADERFEREMFATNTNGE